jgi:SAM-dependent methyltransferase
VIMAALLESPVTTGRGCCSCGGRAWSPVVEDLTDYLTQETFGIHRCNQCGLQMTEPLPEGDAIGRYYPLKYRGNRHGFTGGTRSVLRRRAVESKFPRGFRGRILDIGCGDGSFALHMLARGWQVSATEIDPKCVERLRGLGVDARLSTADEAADDLLKQFDAITCWHVMEHVEHPRHVVEWAKSRLAPGGIFQVTVPNVDCLQAKLFGRRWVHLDVPRHRQHFSSGTLRALVEQAGLEVKQQSNFALEYDWFGVIQSALNVACSTPNVLFDKLTKAPEDESNPIPLVDAVISYALMPPLALASLPMILVGAAVGEGATLTLTCKARA